MLIFKFKLLYFSSHCSDANGLGYILLNNDIPMLYAPDKFLGNQQASYGLDFSVFISLSNATGLKTPTIIRYTFILACIQCIERACVFHVICTYVLNALGWNLHWKILWLEHFK